MVRSLAIFAVPFLVFGSTAIQAGEGAAQGWHSLFNGRNLEGWQIQGGGVWKVQEGAILCHEGGDGEHSWLFSEATFDNFVLHVRFKWERGNSGIQFRSYPKAPLMIGPQADIQLDSETITGSLYDVGGKGMLAQAPKGIVDRLPKDDWIDYEIVCAGERIRLFLNGICTVDTKYAGPAEGHIGFQVHAGDGCLLRWKDIRILELKPGQDFVPLFEGNDVTEGWYEVGEEDWSAKDGTVVGKTEKGGYGWLVTDREFQDFVLSFRYRWTSGNSGVQFRSWLVGEEMHGLQADIDPENPDWTGALYDEHERHLISKAVPEADENYDRERWHSYEISAIGDDIRLFHDGLETVHFKETDPKRIAKGIIALQVHSAPEGQKVHMEWKDLRILNLAPPSPWE